MNKLKMNLKSIEGITLISLVVTIIILIILASISIAMILGNNGLLNKAQTASDETKKSQATETINLKITNIQISSYAETQELPNLQYLADKLCEDNDMEYVLTASKEHASLDKIDVTNFSSIFTKLKEYPYEFEINSSLQLASIDGVKIADNNNDGTVTLTQDQYNSILSRLTALENNSNNTNTNENYSTEEQVIGTWIDGKKMYRKSFPFSDFTVSSTSNEIIINNSIIPNIETVCNLYGKCIWGENAQMALPYTFMFSTSNMGGVFINYDNTRGIRITSYRSSGTTAITSGIITIEYTKKINTDTTN